MSPISRLIILGLFTSWIFACAKGGDSSGTNSNTATVNSVNCIENPQLCQPQVYNTNGFTTYPNQPYGYGNYGYNQGYPYNNSGTIYYGNGYINSGAGPFHYMNNSAYLCNCPAGSMPTYNIYGGLGCVQNQVVGGFSGYAYFGYGAKNNQWMNIPQISNYTGYTQQNCYNGVVQSCLTDQANTCGSGYTCRATSAQSRMGLCVSNTSSNSGQIYR